MTNYTLATGPSSFDLAEILVDRQFRLENGASQTEGRTGNRFGLTLSYEKLAGTRRQTLLQTLALLSGFRHRLVVPLSVLDYIRTGAGTAGTPLVQGAHSANAVAVIIDGWGLTETGILLAGDWIGIASHFYQVRTDVTSDGSGVATVSIWPGLLTDVANNAAVEVDDPTSVFKRVDNVSYTGRPHVSGALIDSITMSLEQDVLA